ncbi:MAG: hypothetical protein M3443_10945 [Actinomycetota bacterium]|nr:hypothetical protein [Actinomycetota bacterium]
MIGHLRVMLQPEWGTGPIWVATGDDFAEPYDADEVTDVLDLSDELRGAIAAWDDRFQNTFNAEYPPDSAFATPEDEAAWLAEGKQLALRLHRELPAADVSYGTIGGKNVPLDDGDESDKPERMVP